jgi:hypothetical protein
MSIGFTDRTRAVFEDDRQRQESPDLGVRIAFLYGCGGTGFRVVFTRSLEGVSCRGCGRYSDRHGCGERREARRRHH